jgi:enoyl-CoA hydratase/carnithine racemase
MSGLMTRKTDTARSKTRKAASKATVARLFFLDPAGRRVMSCNPAGADLKTIVTEAGKLPDGIVVDVEARKPPVAVRASKELMKRPIRAQPEEAVNREIEEFATRVRSLETKEAITAAFFQKRPPDFTKANPG